MDWTETEAAEIATECIAAIEWQTNHVLSIEGDKVATADMIAAVTPKRPATLRIIEAMKQGQAHRAMKELRPPGAADFRIVLFPTTCRSIAGNLADWGFRHEAQQITDALDRGNRALTGH
jgi:hypothetical protein